MFPVTNPFVSQLTVGCVFDGVDLRTVYSASLVILLLFSTDIYLSGLYIPFMVFQSMCALALSQPRTEPRCSISVRPDSL